MLMPILVQAKEKALFKSSMTIETTTWFTLDDLKDFEFKDEHNKRIYPKGKALQKILDKMNKGKKKIKKRIVPSI